MTLEDCRTLCVWGVHFDVMSDDVENDCIGVTRGRRSGRHRQFEHRADHDGWPTDEQFVDGPKILKTRPMR